MHMSLAIASLFKVWTEDERVQIHRFSEITENWLMFNGAYLENLTIYKIYESYIIFLFTCFIQFQI